MVKKVNVQEEMVNEIVATVDELLDGAMNRVDIGDMVNSLIEATERGVSESKIYKLIANRCGLKSEDIRVEQIYTVVKINPLTQTHFPFKSSKLESLRDKLNSNE